MNSNYVDYVSMTPNILNNHKENDRIIKKNINERDYLL
jgi:hypothetical protein